MPASHRHRVLVVDDHDDHRRAVAIYLEASGMDASGAASGREALALLEAGLRPCTVLADLAMPEMDGWEFVGRLREQPTLADVQVIIYSGFPADAERAAATGIRRHLTKPLDPARVVAAIDQICRERASATRDA